MSPNHTAEPTMAVPASGVTVRLYDPGFGDCLLLAFRGEDGLARYMLIDCGVHHSYPGGAERAALVAEDIAKATGKHLHVVVATHEHTDHLYGFKHGRAHFDGMKIDDLWLAWTEDPTNETAQILEDRYGMRIRALAQAVRLLGSRDPMADRLQRVLEFESPEAMAATGGKAEQLTYLRGKSAKKLEQPEDYRHPKKPPLTLEGVPGVKVYVLGPPEDVDWMKSLVRKSELYPELAAWDDADAFAAAVLAASGAEAVGTEAVGTEDGARFERTRPFDEILGIPEGAARDHPEYGRFFRRHYGFANNRYHGGQWRRIEKDWLAAAERLALDINQKTNNTSLVLAIELTESQPRKVLLFAADAQVGNWLSWHELEWPGDDPDDEPMKAEDLLGRTVLYKVGHHGSHNATLKAKGLEMMDSVDLVAMLPVDEEWAKGTQDWEHPAEKLYQRLVERCRGRIIRSDEIPDGDVAPAKPPEATEAEWQAFLGGLDWDRGPHRLWIEYTVGE
jgi:hypothetical protein